MSPPPAPGPLPVAGDFRVGQRAAFAKTLTEADLALFVAVTGDVNPLHVDEEFARRSFFGSRIAHGLLAGALVSTVIGTRLPGTGAIYRAQSFRFRKPSRVGDTLTAEVEVREVDAARGELVLSTTVTNQRGETVIEGEATVALLRALRDPA